MIKEIIIFILRTLPLVLFVVFCVTIYLFLKKKISNLLLMFFGTSDIRAINRQRKYETENTVKSLFGMTSLELPRIKADFPDFDYQKILSIVRLAEESYIKNKIIDKDDFTNNCYKKLSLEFKNKKLKSDLKIHKTVIKKYYRNNEERLISFQSAISYRENGEKIQTRINVDLIRIIQDEYKTSKNKKLIELNCPNCGAPVNFLKSKCAYCHTSFSKTTINKWYINKVELED